MRFEWHAVVCFVTLLPCSLPNGQQPPKQNSSSAKFTATESKDTEPYVVELLQNKIAFKADEWAIEIWF